MKYNMGDIVWVTNLQEEQDVENHLFVVIDDDGQVIPADYFGFVISSHTEKSKEVSNFKYNEPLNMNNTNKLKYNSIVKCDKLYEIPNNSINYKLGTVEPDELNRFLVAYGDYYNNTYNEEN